jgi:hypothetical protein
MVLRIREIVFVVLRMSDARGVLAIASEQHKTVRKDLYATATGLS